MTMTLVIFFIFPASVLTLHVRDVPAAQCRNAAQLISDNITIARAGCIEEN